MYPVCKDTYTNKSAMRVVNEKETPHHNNVSQLKPYAGRLKTNIVPTR